MSSISFDVRRISPKFGHFVQKWPLLMFISPLLFRKRALFAVGPPRDPPEVPQPTPGAPTRGVTPPGDRFNSSLHTSSLHTSSLHISSLHTSPLPTLPLPRRPTSRCCTLTALTAAAAQCRRPVRVIAPDAHSKVIMPRAAAVTPRSPTISPVGHALAFYAHDRYVFQRGAPLKNRLHRDRIYCIFFASV